MGRVWKLFHSICSIPHCSGNEESLAAWVENYARGRGCLTRRDEAGNVVVEIPPSPGMEDRPWVVCQAHLDMVCEKNSESTHDFSSDPIEAVVADGWVKARDTSLGADDGMGVAAALSLLDEYSGEAAPAHGGVELLFTTDEERGLVGASALTPESVRGRILLNLDSEEEGVLYIGCAGGVDTTYTFELPHVEIESLDLNPALVHIGVSGLRGGHSGLNIADGLANAHKLVALVLDKLRERTEGRLLLVEWRGGGKVNAIPREAEVQVILDEDNLGMVDEVVAECSSDFLEEYAPTEPSLAVEAARMVEVPSLALSPSATSRLLDFILALPHGPLAMSPAVPGLVETSSNLAVVRCCDGETVVSTSQRSSVEPALDSLIRSMDALARLAGARVEHANRYPGWRPDPDSPLLKTARRVYEGLFGTPPDVKAIHAGLECGVIGARIPGMDMISFGPTVTGAHSPEERVHIASVERFTRFLLELVKTLQQ